MGFVQRACPRCLVGDRACWNCGGSGRVWKDGPATLNDAGLARLLAMQARMILLGQRNPFRKRQLTAIRWPSPPARTVQASF